MIFKAAAGAAISTMGFVTGLLGNKDAIKGAGGAVNDFKTATGESSLTEFTQITRNDFVTLVEDELITYSEISTVLDRLQSMAAGYYLSAISLLVDIPGVEVIGTLDKLSTDRRRNNHSRRYSSVGREEFGNDWSFGIPAMTDGFTEDGIGLESFVGTESALSNTNLPPSKIQPEVSEKDGDGTVTKTTHTWEKGDSSKTKYAGDHKNIQTIEEQSNLATGKLLQVTFERDGNSVTVPVQIRLSVISTDSVSMENIITFGSIDNTFIERYYRMRAGELKFWKDLIFCSDLVKEAAKARMRDKSGFYKHMMSRRGGNQQAAFKNGPSLNNASAIIVLTSETANRCEEKLGGELTNPRIRNNIFEMTATMLMAVIDERYGIVNIYHRGLATHTELSIKDLKRIKGKGSDVDDILKAYSAGSAPAF